MRIRCFWDLDNFLFDWAKAFAPIRTDVINQGYEPELVDKKLQEANEEGFTLELWLEKIGALKIGGSRLLPG